MSKDRSEKREWRALSRELWMTAPTDARGVDGIAFLHAVGSMARIADAIETVLGPIAGALREGKRAEADWWESAGRWERNRGRLLERCHKAEAKLKALRAAGVKIPRTAPQRKKPAQGQGGAGSNDNQNHNQEQ